MIFIKFLFLITLNIYLLVFNNVHIYYNDKTLYQAIIFYIHSSINWFNNFFSIGTLNNLLINFFNIKYNNGQILSPIKI